MFMKTKELYMVLLV